MILTLIYVWISFPLASKESLHIFKADEVSTSSFFSFSINYNTDLLSQFYWTSNVSNLEIERLKKITSKLQTLQTNGAVTHAIELSI